MGREPLDRKRLLRQHDLYLARSQDDTFPGYRNT
jgi:hypothetical protein